MKVITLLSGQDAPLLFPPNCPSQGCNEECSYAGLIMQMNMIFSNIE